MSARVAILACLMVVALPVWADEEAIRLRTLPRHFAFAPSNVVVEIRLLPADTDRWLRVLIDGENFYRSSEWDIEGIYAPRFYRVEWRAVPAGTYEVIAAVGNRDSVRATARASFYLIE